MPRYAAARDQLIDQLPEAISSFNSRVTVQTVALQDPPEGLLAWFKEKNFLAGTRLFEYIHVEGVSEIDQTWLSEQDDIEETFIRAVATDELGKAIELVLVLSELAYPGCINTLECALVSDAIFTNTVPKKGSHTHLGFPEKPVWPTVEFIELGNVVAWAKRTNIVTNALASSRVERALAAYSHIIGLSWQRDGELLFRAMQGLEAFYIDGTGDLRRQLSTKVQLWLGPWKENKNLVGHLYDLRSAFVHGSSQLTFWNRDSAAWDEDAKHMQKFEEHVHLSIRLLVRTLQECIIRGVTSVEWSYGFETNGVSTPSAARPDA